MISYPSSFQSSRRSDKENVNPNSIKVKGTGFSPLLKERITNNDSGKSEQFLSVYRTIQDSKNEGTQNSMKTLLQGFCSTIEESQENFESENFVDLATKYFNKGQLTRKQLIQLCLAHQIYSIQQVSAKFEGSHNEEYPCSNMPLKNILCTNLGKVIMQQLCHSLKKGENISKQHQRIIQLLIPPNFEDEINANVIMQHYDILKGEVASEQAEKKNLSVQFSGIHRTKIEPKLWSDHFRLEISKKLNNRHQRQRLSYHSLCKCFSNILTQGQISLVFRYIYALETDSLMAILDTSKTISLTLLKANIFRHGQVQIHEFELEQKNVNFHLEQNHKRIKKLQGQQVLHLELLANKDKQIDRLQRVIELMKIEKEENERIMKRQMEIQLEAVQKKYEKRIEDLIESKKEETKLTQWYQRQLEAVVEAVNKQNVMRRYLVHKF